MKRLLAEIVVVGLILFLFASCAPKHQFQTRSGKKKINHYNSIQYGQQASMKKKKSKS